MLNEPESLVNESSTPNLAAQALPTPVGELHLGFRTLSGQKFALPTLGIREVLSLSPDQITPVPNGVSLGLGILNLRGRVIWVVDSEKLLKDIPEKKSPPAPEGRSAVLKHQAELPVIVIEVQEQLLGLAVQQVAAMDWLRLDDLQPGAQGADKSLPFLQGEWIESGSGEPLRLLNPEVILQFLQSISV